MKMKYDTYRKKEVEYDFLNVNTKANNQEINDNS